MKVKQSLQDVCQTAPGAFDVAGESLTTKGSQGLLWNLPAVGAEGVQESGEGHTMILLKCCSCTVAKISVS
jgi:hypothetical protein